MRVGIVLAVYAVGALLLLPLLGALQRLLILPELFLVLARVGLWLGAPLAVVLAWRYPDIGNGAG
jgi:hypothetical protein